MYYAHVEHNVFISLDMFAIFFYVTITWSIAIVISDPVSMDMWNTA